MKMKNYKKIIFVGLVFLLCLLPMAACSLKPSLLDQISDMFDEEIEELYLYKVVMSGIAAQDWEDPKEIEPDNLVYFYAYTLDSGQWPDEGIIQQEEVESTIQNHFAVSTEHIRQSRLYNPAGGYYQIDGIGGAGYIKLEEYWVKEDENLLELTYGIYSPDDESLYVWGGVILLEVKGEQFKYLSNVQTMQK